MHTDVTLDLLSQATISFGTKIRAFQEKTCATFSTHELEREWAARVRRQDKIKKAAVVEYALAHTPTPSIPYHLHLLSYLFHILSIPYLIVSILSHLAVDYIRLYVM